MISGTDILITGGSGLLGKYLIDTNPHGHCISTMCSNPVIHPKSKQMIMNIRDRIQVEHVFMLAKPKLVIHTAAIGDVNFCEHSSNHAHEVNVVGTKHIADLCDFYGAKMVFISTNAVFDGMNPPYKEGDETNPLSYYGYTKVEAEKIVRYYNPGNHMIVRTMWLYGNKNFGGRDTWIDHVRRNAGNGRQMEVVDDLINQPTYAKDLADAIWKMISLELNGTYHVCGNSIMSLYKFARLIAYTYGWNQDLIHPIKLKDYETVAKRPPNTTFNTTLAEKMLIYMPSAEDALRRLRDGD